MGEGEKCLVCDENNIKICGKCNEFYELVEGKCYEIKYTIRGVYLINKEKTVHFINPSFLEDIESLRVDDEIKETPISEYTEPSIVDNKIYHVYFVMKNKEYTSFEKMFENTDLYNIEFSPNFETKSLTNTAFMFNSAKLSEITLNNFDTSKVTNMESMFCNTVVEDPTFFGKFQLDNVVNMDKMFYRTLFETFTFPNLNAPHLTSIEEFLFSNTRLWSIDISNFNAPNLLTMKGMFNNNYDLKYIELKDLNAPKYKRNV